ncbi:MAG: MBL fold metallo-hydrolase, partial [Chloroflexota bacterium]|nr:MBL fold metallo-hydrolase [Chloroflexota bacterium]
RNWEPFVVPPSDIDAVLLTHAHVDHCGLIPKLVREGFRGRIYGTAATCDIAEIMLLDSAKLQEEDAEFKKRRHEREGRRGPYPEIPLYTIDDAKTSLPLFSPVRYGQPVHLDGGIAATFYDAGHVLGASMIKISIQQGGNETTIIFSGDIGRWNRPILRDPTLFDEADYIVVESTYGDRLHETPQDIGDQLATVIRETVEAGGNIVIPSFALERSQEVLYHLNLLINEGRIPRLLVFLDSPMAVNITDIFEHHPDLYDDEMTRLVNLNMSPFDMPGLEMVRTVAESKAINYVKGSAIIISGSGMCTGGRIKHHLVTNISRPESTILFVGYQAVGTLGREIVDGAKQVRILGQHYPVQARVAQIQGFSAHADRDDLFRWLSALKRSPKHVFVTHGEPEVARSFGAFVREKTGWSVSLPEYKTEVILD